jgi:hypothetical protein
MICGDDTGLCKRLSDVDGRVVVRWGEQAAGAAVHRLTLRGSTLACGRANGSVDLYELVDDDAALPPGRSRSDSRKGRMGIAGLAFASDDRLVVADEAGAIDVLDCARGLARVGEARASGGSDGLHTAQLRVDGAGALAATGGRDHELRIWDLVTMEVSWKARNVRAARARARRAAPRAALRTRPCVRARDQPCTEPARTVLFIPSAPRSPRT